jgi:hypothetical protein
LSEQRKVAFDQLVVKGKDAVDDEDVLSVAGTEVIAVSTRGVASAAVGVSHSHSTPSTGKSAARRASVAEAEPACASWRQLSPRRAARREAAPHVQGSCALLMSDKETQSSCIAPMTIRLPEPL